MVLVHRVACLLNQRQVLLHNRRNGQTNLLAKIFEVALVLSVVQSFVFVPQVPVLSHHLDLFDEDTEVEARLFFVHVFVFLFFVVQRNLRYFGKKFDSLDSRTTWLDQISQNLLDEIGLKNVSKRDPG